MSAPRIRIRPLVHSVAAEITSNVVLFEPPPKPVQKLTSISSTTGPSLLTEVTANPRRKLNQSNGLLNGPGLDRCSGGLSPAREKFFSAEDPAFQRFVATSTAMELRRAFVLEETSHRNMLGRAREGGYTVHPDFRNFRSFLQHVGPRPSKDFTLDRIDPRNPVYGPGLVRWADKRQQANNRRNTKHLTKDGVTRPLTDWGRITNQDPRTIVKRIERGWSHEEAISGRRVKTEVASNAPQIRLITVPNSTSTSPLDRWPPGVAKSDWERAFLEFHKRFGKQLGAGLRRLVFFTWIAGNNCRQVHKILDERHPSPEDAPGSNIPMKMSNDPIYEQYWALSPVVLGARCATFGDNDARDLLIFLEEKFPRRTRLIGDQSGK